MKNMLHFLRAFGGNPLDRANIAEADWLLLAQAAYSSFPEGEMSFGEALTKAIQMPVDERRFGFERRRDEQLLREMAESGRFGDQRFLGGSQVHAPDCQFAGYALGLSGGGLIVCFRGTDSSLAGWKEDCRLAYDCPIPAQRHAVEFLTRTARQHPHAGPLFLTGHSKGGNLAVYAAAFCPPDVRGRVERVVNLDGPGLDPRSVESPGYREIRDRIYTFLPAGSLIGLLFAPHANVTHVRARAPSLMQHYPYFWEMRGGRFRRAAGSGPLARYQARTVRAFIDRLTPREREDFVEALFGIAAATRADTFPKLLRAWHRSIPRAAGAFVRANGKARRALARALYAAMWASVRGLRGSAQFSFAKCEDNPQDAAYTGLDGEECGHGFSSGHERRAGRD